MNGWIHLKYLMKLMICIAQIKIEPPLNCKNTFYQYILGIWKLIKV